MKGERAIKVLSFKTVSPLFEMERDGIKPFTERLYDRRDGRFRILSRWQPWLKYNGRGVVIRITNPANGESFCRRLAGKRYMPRTYPFDKEQLRPSWMILYLGEKLELPDVK